MNLTFVTTGDGSKTLYNAVVGEHYHSRNGAMQESVHVFLNSGLKYFLDNTSAKSVAVLEVGLGTGLNFLLTADYCTKNAVQLNYTGIEAFPLATEIINQTGYDNYINKDIWNSFQSWYPSSINHVVTINNYCKLKTAHTTLSNFESFEQYDIIYFDAFAAQRQPEMWNETSINHIISFLKPGGIFVTYAITGNLKRALKALGLTVEKAPGAPGKREMLRATN